MQDRIPTPITSHNIRKDFYFSFHTSNEGGYMTLQTPDGAYDLTPAAAEDLMVNFQTNLEAMQMVVNR